MNHTQNFASRASLVLLFVVVLTGTAVGQLKVLHRFHGPDGFYPRSGLILDANGNLYGTTPGGVSDLGNAFELSEDASGRWTETLLYDFGSGSTGYAPSSLIFDSAGNLYGTARYSGVGKGGTVFELSPPFMQGVPWNIAVLASFTVDSFGPWDPQAALTMDASGNLYSTTDDGGTYGGGTAFELTPSGNGTWSLSTLYNFCSVGSDCLDGYFPSNLVFDASGNLYGTTRGGGAFGAGTIFELTPSTSGGWIETVLYSFCSGGGRCRDGKNPIAGLTFDAAGNLYGTTLDGGAKGKGTVFMLTRSGTSWSENVLYSFRDAPDGAHPMAGVTFDGNGNLYGTCFNGGNGVGSTGEGTLFELIPGATDWTEKQLVQFNGSDGASPSGSLVFDSAGNLYGTTFGGGITPGEGTIFEFTP